MRFNVVRTSKPYGDIDIEKDECIGHVQKRLGKALRDLKKKSGKDKLSGGKPLCVKSRLTENYMGELQAYSGKATRKVSDLQGMAKTIRAFHSASRDSKPRHGSCPPG